jgi:NAD(P) transhydrogenase subunit alpha
VIVGIPRETRPGERRVAITPTAIPPLLKAGLEVVVESGAGLASGVADEAYAERGARVGDRAAALGADLVAMVNVMGGDATSPDLAVLRRGQAVVGMAAPLAAPALVAALAGRGVSLFALELVPRTTRAQSMDVLSSQANVGGYRAVLTAALELPKMFPLLTTAAGTIRPAKVFIVGAGVAGLSAIATARRLGAVVEAYDVRPAVREEVESLGARFVELPLETDQGGGGSGAYAQQMSEETLARQRELMARTVAGSDVLITTAQVQGAKAPLIVTTGMIRGMGAGSVVVDMAAEQGGNCEPTVAGETVEVDGVRVIGPVNLPGTAPFHASQLYGKNVANFLAVAVQDGRVALDSDDDIVRDTLVVREGEVLNARVREALGLAPLPEPQAPPEPAADAAPEEVAR